MNEPQAPPPQPTPPPPGDAVPPSQDRGVLRGFLVSSAISAGVALLGLALLTAGIGLLIIMPYAVIQLAWTLPLFFSWRKQGKRGEAKGALISCAVNVVASIACWGIATSSMSFK